MTVLYFILFCAVCVCTPGIKWTVCNMHKYSSQLIIAPIKYPFAQRNNLFPFLALYLILKSIQCDWVNAQQSRTRCPEHSFSLHFFFRTQKLDTLLDACGNKFRLRFRFAITLAYKCSRIVTMHSTFYLSKFAFVFMYSSLNNRCKEKKWKKKRNEAFQWGIRK